MYLLNIDNGNVWGHQRLEMDKVSGKLVETMLYWQTMISLNNFLNENIKVTIFGDYTLGFSS
jgi:hypothetical protein